MTALLRLAFYSFLFGGGIPIFLAALRIAVRLFLPLSADFPEKLRKKLPQYRAGVPHGMSARLFRCTQFLRDLSLALFLAVACAVFLFRFGDGIPRLFVFLAAMGGAFAVHRILGRFLSKVEHGFVFFTRFFFLCVWSPLSSFWGKIGAAARLSLQKVVGAFIKAWKRQNTKHRSRQYERKATSAFGDRRMQKAILDALREQNREEGQ